jgi:hypothetical protein
MPKKKGDAEMVKKTVNLKIDDDMWQDIQDTIDGDIMINNLTHLVNIALYRYIQNLKNEAKKEKGAD